MIKSNLALLRFFVIVLGNTCNIIYIVVLGAVCSNVSKIFFALRCLQSAIEIDLFINKTFLVQVMHDMKYVGLVG